MHIHMSSGIARGGPSRANFAVVNCYLHTFIVVYSWTNHLFLIERALHFLQNYDNIAETVWNVVKLPSL